MSWKESLVRAADVSPLAISEAPRITSVLDEALAGTLTRSDLASAVGTSDHPRPGYIEAIDAAIRNGYRAEPAFSAARAVLYELPGLLATLRVAVDSEMSEHIPTRTQSVLARIVQHEQTVLANEARALGERRCPRCGSHQISELHTDAVEPRFIEVKCRACGEYDSWSEGEPDATRWQAL